MASKAWSKADIKYLRQHAKQGRSSTLTAFLLDRTPGAVRFKAMTEGVRFRSLGRKHSAKQKARWV
jgi:hypothetical protein